MDAWVIRLQNTFPGAPKPAPASQNEPKQERKVAEGAWKRASRRDRRPAAEDQLSGGFYPGNRKASIRLGRFQFSPLLISVHFQNDLSFLAILYLFQNGLKDRLSALDEVRVF